MGTPRDQAGKASERRFFEEIWNKGNFAVATDLVAPDYVDHDSSNSSVGPESVRQEVSMYRDAFPDLLALAIEGGDIAAWAHRNDLARR